MNYHSSIMTLLYRSLNMVSILNTYRHKYNSDEQFPNLSDVIRSPVNCIGMAEKRTKTEHHAGPNVWIDG